MDSEPIFSRRQLRRELTVVLIAHTTLVAALLVYFNVLHPASAQLSAINIWDTFLVSHGLTVP